MLLKSTVRETYYIDWVTGAEEFNRIYSFLKYVDLSFFPTLSSRVNINKYAKKIANKACSVFISDGVNDLASASLYCNRSIAFLTSIAVKEEYYHQQLGTYLMDEIISYCRKCDCNSLRLETNKDNKDIIKFYTKFGLKVEKIEEDSCFMIKEFGEEKWS